MDLAPSAKNIKTQFLIVIDKSGGVLKSPLGGFYMLNYNVGSYEKMLGNINEKAVVMSRCACMSQCTGCMCNCRCSCSVIMTEGLDWEEM